MLRPFESRDRASCLAIYRHNEHGYFLAEFIVYFELWLDSDEFLKLVLCIDDVPVAIGAVSCENRFGLATVSRVNQGGKRDNQDGKFLGGVVFEPFCSDLTL